MNRALRVSCLLSVIAITTVGGAHAQQDQGAIVDKLASKVIDHYQNTSCQQLAAEKQQGPSSSKSAKEQKALQYLKSNPQAAQAFINKVAAPIANKMFECGMLP